MLTFGSLFAGIGGIDLGLERAGLRCCWQVEIDDYATRVLAKHWPDVPRFRDVRRVGADCLLPVDVVAGGFPCQDISSAGKRAGLSGERSGLWREFGRIVRELRPCYVFVENVASLLSPHRRKGRRTDPAAVGAVLGDLAALGYDAEWHCIPAAYIGAPHIRDRVFVVAYAPSGGWRENGERLAFAGCPAGPAMAVRRSGSPALSDTAIARVGQLAARQQGTQTQAYHADRRGETLADADGPRHGRAAHEVRTGRYAPVGSCASGDPWRVEPDVGRVAHGVPARVDRLRGLGNAVVPQVAELVGGWIAAHAAAAA